MALRACPEALGRQNAQGRSLCGGGAAGARPGQRESPSGAAPANLVVPAFFATSRGGAKSRSSTAISTRESSAVGLREQGGGCYYKQKLIKLAYF